ncbi:MAG: hypothetical protein ABI618_08115 [Nitrospirota bacterium]
MAYHDVVPPGVLKYARTSLLSSSDKAYLQVPMAVLGCPFLIVSEVPHPSSFVLPGNSNLQVAD